MSSKRYLRVKVLGRHEDAEAEVELSKDAELGWRALVVVQPPAKNLAHETAWFDRERDALAAAATWMHRQFDASVTCLGTVVAISQARQAA